MKTLILAAIMSAFFATSATAVERIDQTDVARCATYGFVIMKGFTNGKNQMNEDAYLAAYWMFQEALSKSLDVKSTVNEASNMVADFMSTESNSSDRISYRKNHLAACGRIGVDLKDYISGGRY